MATVDELLSRTSRTFALAIPLLPEPCRTEVSLAYLLFRIADTFEDAAVWPRARRVEALAEFTDLLAAPSAGRAEALATGWLRAPPTDHPGYLELLRETAQVVTRAASLAPVPRAIVLRHATRTSDGMASIVRRANDDGTLELADVADLKGYCYVVAGIVGELLTELFLHHAPPLEACARALTDAAAGFGEALQLVNILKDAADDAEEGRRFLPRSVPRSELFALAARDLDAACGYVRALETHDAPRGIVAFCALPVLLARATLAKVERDGPGAKVPRAEVAALFAAMNDALDRGAPTLAG